MPLGVELVLCNDIIRGQCVDGTNQAGNTEWGEGKKFVNK